MPRYCSTYQWKEIYGRELLYSGPLFTHQLSHLWIDFRGIRDGFMREHDTDYFENSRQATFVQQEYAIGNPLGFEGYGEHCWGFTACDGPGWTTRRVNGVERQFFDYVARGAPFGPDDGTVAPVGRCCLAAVCAGDRHPDGSHIGAAGPRDDGALRLQAFVQPDLRRRGQPHGMVGDAVPLRHRPGPGGVDDRELPHWSHLEHHAPLPARDRGACAAPASPAAGCDAGLLDLLVAELAVGADYELDGRERDDRRARRGFSG